MHQFSCPSNPKSGQVKDLTSALDEIESTSSEGLIPQQGKIDNFHLNVQMSKL